MTEPSGMEGDLEFPVVIDDDGTTWVPVATVKDLRRSKKKLVEVNGHKIAVFWDNETAYAFQNTCIHKKRHLARGTLLSGRVVCPGHQWAFDLDTGYERSQDACQPTYPARVEGDHIYVVLEKRVVIENTSWDGGLMR